MTGVMVIIGMIAPWSHVWIKEPDSGWDNKRMLLFFAHTILCVMASYLVGYIQGVATS
jgi:hypothetical protein